MRARFVIEAGATEFGRSAALVLVSVGLSLQFACAAPIAAFAAVAALTRDRANALMLTAAVWLANQIVGYGCLAYPITLNSLGWGLALGAAALLGTISAKAVGTRLQSSAILARASAALAAAVASYQGTLLVISMVVLGGEDDYSPMILSRIVIIDAITMAALVAVTRPAAVLAQVMRPSRLRNWRRLAGYWAGSGASAMRTSC